MKKNQAETVKTGTHAFNIDSVDNQQTTALMKASINGHLKIVELLLKFGASPRLLNNREENALTLSIMQENFNICERLLIAKGDINFIDRQGMTPLLKAAKYNSQTKVLDLLLKYGANLDISDANANTPLHFAAMRGAEVMAKYLIKLGANPYARNNANHIPVELCTND